MKKVLFSLVMACVAISSAKAQDVLLATLQKGETTQYFYGSDAFKEAMEAAENGNTITLGAGTYNAIDITKAVSIYGNGYEMRADTTSQKEGNMAFPTRIAGDFAIALEAVNDTPAKGLYIEGIYSADRVRITKHLSTASFVKCRFYKLTFWDAENKNMTTSDGVSIIHCRVANWLEPGDSQNMVVSNSIISYLGSNAATSSILLQNNVIDCPTDSFIGTFRNNIIYRVDRYKGFESAPADHPRLLKSECTAYNNLFNYDALENVVVQSSNYRVTFYGFFVSDYNDASQYTLPDEWLTQYIGTDGTQVGIYGGSSPFNTILTIPTIVSKDIAPQTENGKLKVSITVKAGDNTL
ncbi:hypothetical protein [Bacteroides timonensis]|uniref:hypothetical protein n=1 Tax=Bacteroides timonensis TaxID=1470345 RepID=UPI0004BAA7A3|nr:hypothetical protein [Bacteroides timonensis]